MARPVIYVHRNGAWARRYFTEANQARLAEFADVIDDSPLEAAPPDLAAKIAKADGILSLNGIGAEEITPEILRGGKTKVAAISHWFHGSHDRGTAGWRSAGVHVIDSSDGNNFAVAQWTLGATITGVFRFAEHDRAMRSGEYWPEHEFASGVLDSHVVGIIGLGRIGRLVADLLKPFHVTLIGYDKYIGPEQAAKLGVRWMPLDEVMRTASIITFHLPVTDEDDAGHHAGAYRIDPAGRPRHQLRPHGYPRLRRVHRRPEGEPLPGDRGRVRTRTSTARRSDPNSSECRDDAAHCRIDCADVQCMRPYGHRRSSRLVRREEIGPATPCRSRRQGKP